MQPLIVIDPADLMAVLSRLLLIGCLIGLFAFSGLAALVRALGHHVVGPISRIRSARERALRRELDRMQVMESLQP